VSLGCAIGTAGCIDIASNAASKATGGPPATAADGRVLTDRERFGHPASPDDTPLACFSGTVQSAGVLGGPLQGVLVSVSEGQRAIHEAHTDAKGAYRACVERRPATFGDRLIQSGDYAERSVTLVLRFSLSGYQDRVIESEWSTVDHRTPIDVVLERSGRAP
jgi:hypothetical protein